MSLVLKIFDAGIGRPNPAGQQRFGLVCCQNLIDRFVGASSLGPHVMSLFESFDFLELMSVILEFRECRRIPMLSTN